MLETLDHVIVAVPDIDEAAQSYATLLGRAPSWRGSHPAQGTANALFRLANTYVELLAPNGPGGFADAVRRHLEAHGPGLFGVAFGTSDLDGARARLAASGFDPAPAVAGSGRDEASGAERRWRMMFLPSERTRGVLAFLIEHEDDSDPLLPIAEVECEVEASLSALDHVVLRTAAPDEAIALYADSLGIRLALDRGFEKRGVRLLFFRLGGVTFEVAAALPTSGSEVETSGEPSDGTVDRLWGLAFQAADVRKAHERLALAGIEVSPVRTGNKPGTIVFTVGDQTCGVPTLVIGPE